jgi:hypothetical protein
LSTTNAVLLPTSIEIGFPAFTKYSAVNKAAEEKKILKLISHKSTVEYNDYFNEH